MTQDDSDTSGTTPTRRKRSDGLRTIERVLKAAEDEMAEFGFVKFNLDRVMEKSGVARSSVYHHFGGRDGVIAALETSSTMRSLERETAEFETFLDTLTSGEQAFELIELGVSKEQARSVLPLNLNTTMIWTGSLYSFIRLCKQRLKPDAQAETRMVVEEMLKQVKEDGSFKEALNVYEL